MSVEVLVVDDNLDAAKGFARLIELKAQLNVAVTDDPDKAIELLKNNPIKVAVLDQRMPKSNGTELFKDLIKVDPLLQAIMLTGEAEIDELHESNKLGFADYLHKSKVTELPAMVLVYYCSYQNELANKYSDKREHLYTHNTGIFGLGKHKIDFYLLSSETIDKAYVPEDSWITEARCNAGEKTTFTTTKINTQKVIIESEEKTKLNIQLGLKIPVLDGLTGKIQSSVESKIKSSVHHEESVTESIEKEYKLPDEPAELSTVHVKSRKYEKAPVYEQLKLTIRKECNSCNAAEIFSLNVNLLLPKISTRQVDYFSDDSNKVTNTGVQSCME